ncbi:MAG: ParB/RepB/Spo0J family partition protein [Chloroflexi bacterium]|nr:ParB/RepB/Spo0J family partition protein [Chloroflexota bacterium]
MVDSNGQGQTGPRPTDAPRGLGRGLSALIPDTPAEPRQAALGAVHEAPIGSIAPNPEQPRSAFDDEALEELTQSVREHGVIQPLLVTELPDDPASPAGPRYQLIAGERRLRAAQAAGLERVPVTVRESVPREQLVLALIENVQREDLNPLEESRAYKRLVDDYGLTQQQVAERVGRSRASVTNRLRLLELSPPAQHALVEGAISEGHARALLALRDPVDQVEALERVQREGLSVRDTERLAKRMAEGVSKPRRPAPPDPQVEAVIEALRRELGTKVTMRRGSRGRGSLTIHFGGDEELNGVLDRLLPEDAFG